MKSNIECVLIFVNHSMTVKEYEIITIQNKIDYVSVLVRVFVFHYVRLAHTETDEAREAGQLLAAG